MGESGGTKQKSTTTNNNTQQTSNTILAVVQSKVDIRDDIASSPGLLKTVNKILKGIPGVLMLITAPLLR